ncbi:MAG: sigma-54-dependent Fis family transcriptional regulator [Candidatus Latescibacteria bacterium]|nr:sigma-54-dependent Fis family transcriptional regulator [Candidatus Latescibacterota bacterium]
MISLEEKDLVSAQALGERGGRKTDGERGCRGVKSQCDCSTIVGVSPAVQEICRKVSKMGPARCAILITGESGTGKELVARSLHHNSPRREAPMVVVNCAAIPANLMESELFGHVRGAFTDAVKDKPGLIEAAAGGTLFLDEISELSLEMQSKLLRALEQGEFRRVGDTLIHRPEVRIVAATNKDLRREVEEGRFRADLFYRLKVLSIHIPSLRERREDIPVLARYFLEKHTQAHSGIPLTITPEAVAALTVYEWPGNVRELSHMIEYAVVMAEGAVIDVSDLLLEQTTPATGLCISIPMGSFGLKDAVHRATYAVEAELIARALQTANFNHTYAARLLGISRRALLYKLNERRLDQSGVKEAAQQITSQEVAT